MQNPGGELRGAEPTAKVPEPSREIVKELLIEELLVEEISIDGMCGVY